MKPFVPLAVMLALLPCACAHAGSGPGAGPATPLAPGELNAKIGLRLTAIGVRHGTLGHLVPTDAPGNDLDTFDFSATNRTAKIVSSFDADVELTNDAGKVLYRGRLAESSIVEPGKSFDIEDTVVNAPRSLPNPELVRGASPARTRLTYRILDIGYADGTKDSAS